MTNYIHLVLQMEELLLGLQYLFNMKGDSRIAGEVFIFASLNFSNKAVIYFFKTEGAETAASNKCNFKTTSLISSVIKIWLSIL